MAKWAPWLQLYVSKQALRVKLLALCSYLIPCLLQALSNDSSPFSNAVVRIAALCLSDTDCAPKQTLSCLAAMLQKVNIQKLFILFVIQDVQFPT